MSSQALPSVFRGVYQRVARRLGVDPSYVSRVARHERRSELVSAELQKEVDEILADTHAVLAQSVSAHIELAATLCRLAQKRAAQGEPDEKLTRHARRALENALSFLPKLDLERKEFEEIREKTERLRVEAATLEEMKEGAVTKPRKHSGTRSNGREL